MAKPDLSALFANPQGRIHRQMGMGLEFLPSNRVIERQILKRTGATVAKELPLDFTNLGPGWESLGGNVGIEDALDLSTHIKIYRNGQLLVNDLDFYFIEKNKIAFVFSIRTSEVLQISKNFEE